MAPAVTVGTFSRAWFDGRTPRFPLPTLYVLDDATERADTVGPYGKSLLYLPLLVVAGRNGVEGAVSKSRSHGGFDNDVDTMNSILFRVLGQKPSRPFTQRDLVY